MLVGGVIVDYQVNIQFCVRYRVWRETLDLPMRQEHKAGERMFVDYCGHTMPVTNPKTGGLRPAQIFVATLGASNYTDAEASWTQSLPEWVMAHVRAFAFYGGGARLVVSDNLKAGVTIPHRYEPEANRAYEDYVFCSVMCSFEWIRYYFLGISQIDTT